MTGKFPALGKSNGLHISGSFAHRYGTKDPLDLYDRYIDGSRKTLRVIV